MPSKPVLWITRALSDNTLARARKDYDVILDPADNPASAQSIIEHSQKVDAIIPCHSEIFTENVVNQLHDRVRIIANHSVGVDHCNLKAFEKRGIVVTNTPDVLSDATAEIAFLLLLGAARKAVEGDTLVRSGQWTTWSPSFMVGQQVTGKTLGIIGMGKVGQVMAKRARGFDMVVHYHNRSRLSAQEEQGAVFHESLDTLLPKCDYLSLHCPATEATKGLINTDTLAKLPKGAILVNTARGALVDETALLESIESGHLYAAGLDCFATEPCGNPALAKHQNIFTLPHIGSATYDTRDAMGFRALDNLDAFFSGAEPRDRLV